MSRIGRPQYAADTPTTRDAATSFGEGQLRCDREYLCAFVPMVAAPCCRFRHPESTIRNPRLDARCIKPSAIRLMVGAGLGARQHQRAFAHIAGQCSGALELAARFLMASQLFQQVAAHRRQLRVAA